MGTIRQLKKIKKGKASPSPLDPKMMEAWNQGYKAGIKHQRESDIKFIIGFLESLVELVGIGQKTTEKIIKHFLSKFGN